MSFRKPGCGIEGKWRSGLEGVSCVPGFSLFQQEDGFGLWIPGCGGWICGFGVDLARGWRGGVVHNGGILVQFEDVRKVVKFLRAASARYVVDFD